MYGNRQLCDFLAEFCTFGLSTSSQFMYGNRQLSPPGRARLMSPRARFFSVYSLGSSWCCERMADTEAGGPKSHARRDLLIDIASKAQKRWQEEKCFEQDAPLKGTKEYDQPKHFVTFPYPYMNGTLHLGHTFSLTKTEFSMGYERLKGKKTLWPFGECRTQDCGTSPRQHGSSPVTASQSHTSNPSSSP